MRISARADYALRACLELARAGAVPCRSQEVARAQGIPHPFLQNILGDMRRAGIVRSSGRRGGGYLLAAPADQIAVADVVRAMDGPLVSVHRVDPNDLRYPESAAVLETLWIAVRENVEAVLEHVSLHDLATGRLPIPGSEPAADARLGPSSALAG